MNEAETMVELVSKIQREGNWQELIDKIPYAKFIGISVLSMGDEIVFKMDPLASNTGNPILPALHGGVIAGFMETAATLNMMMRLDVVQVPKIIDLTVDYLRSGAMKDTYATCILNRQGRRVANVQVLAWQKNRDTPIASARAHFLFDDDE